MPDVINLPALLASEILINIHPEPYRNLPTQFSSIDAGIHPGDLLIVDRALEPTNRRVVIAVVDGDLTVKRVCQKQDQLFLVPENKDYRPLRVKEEMDLRG